MQQRWTNSNLTLRALEREEGRGGEGRGVGKKMLHTEVTIQ